VSSSIELGVRRALDPRVIDLQRTVRWITAACLSGPGLIVVAAISFHPRAPFALKLAFLVAWLAGSLLLAWFAQKWPPIAYRYASYTVDEHGIEIRRGVVWRAVTNVPRTRVQHTDVSQGPLERSHGLGTLVIHTAGTVHAIVALHGLDYATATALRNHLLPGGAADAV
jgi:membrane protein YdbS with pleckstrin-like domain